jgi:cytochrome c553
MKYDKNKTWLYNMLFLLVCGAILLFLWNAPAETTKKLPQDAIHLKFHTMEKKDAEKFCEECHNPKGEVPLPKNHPPKYRCLFCHKQIKK